MHSRGENEKDFEFEKIEDFLYVKKKCVKELPDIGVRKKVPHHESTNKAVLFQVIRQRNSPLYRMVLILVPCHKGNIRHEVKRRNHPRNEMLEIDTLD